MQTDAAYGRRAASSFVAPLRVGWRPLGAVAAIAIASAASLLLGSATAVLPATRLVLGCLCLGLVLVVAARPAAGAYLLLFLTPLLAGIDRGGAIPYLRPSEAVTALVGLGVFGRRIVDSLAGARRRARPSRVDRAVIVLAATSSVLPFLWMVVRGLPLAADDVLYGLMLWKFAAIYFIFRSAIRKEREVRACLWTAMLAGAIVSLIAVLQAIGVGAVTSFVRTYFSPYGNTKAVLNNRGGATLGLPIAAADLLIFDLAIASGLLVTSGRRVTRRRTVGFALPAFAALSVIGIIASGEFSALIGLLAAVVMLGLITRRHKTLIYLLPASIIASALLRPVVERRLAGFRSVGGLPASWIGRLYNLTNYFWPELFSRGHFLLGVRPAARVIVPTQATGYVWIESGYTWLLWSGGIPLVVAFGWFTYTVVARGVALARSRTDAIGVAALASAVGVSVVALLMVLDPHLTYRGSGDLLFALIALAGTREATVWIRRGSPT